MNYCNGDKDTASTFCNPCPYEGNCENCEMDRENVIRHIREEIENAKFWKKHYATVSVNILSDAYELLKEQEVVVKQWTKEIADNQLAHAPKDSHEFMSLNEHLDNEYKRGIWDGLQIAWNIISDGR